MDIINKKSESKCKIFCASEQGAVGPNEDAYIILNHENYQLLGIFDGHGTCGKLAAQTGHDYLKDNFVKTFDKENITAWLEDTFEKIHQTFSINLLKNCNRIIDKNGVVRNKNTLFPIRGGTTATIIIVETNDDGKKTIYSANVGDSQAFIIYKNSWKIECLTESHEPTSEKEYDRILKSNCEHKLIPIYDKLKVDKQLCPRVFCPDRTKNKEYLENPLNKGLLPKNIRYEPASYLITLTNEISNSKDSACIAMSRSIGDFYIQQYGLIYNPSIKITNVENKSVYIILATDGLWDVWKYEDLCALVAREHDDINMMQHIFQESIKRGKHYFQNDYDDTTMIMVEL